ncbi:hypothetical protein [Trinickia diaoshuihuensis]|uniref:hypothetical protein n=1 Tax=Trinickia diaoshuihuensis TaxID=2292265 RepID=UPI0013C33355|nr:hypothetical protein [Trinickia diaoshuihuensis]
MRYEILRSIVGVFVLVELATSCSSTPNHTNTLIFGTNTLVAVDVSESPTGNVGVTLGYKRQEAVWMPLLANVASDTGGEVPATCTDDSCKSFTGTTGTDGTLNGASAHDTYSVLATFSGQTAASAPVGASGANVTAGGAIAQYFATGFAARLLAEKGGAAIVSTSGDTGNDAAVNLAAQQQLQTQSQHIERIISAITDKSGNIDATQRDKLFGAAKFSNENIKKYLLESKNANDLRVRLNSVSTIGVQPLFDALS